MSMKQREKYKKGRKRGGEEKGRRNWAERARKRTPLKWRPQEDSFICVPPNIPAPQDPP